MCVECKNLLILLQSTGVHSSDRILRCLRKNLCYTRKKGNIVLCPLAIIYPFVIPSLDKKFYIKRM